MSGIILPVGIGVLGYAAIGSHSASFTRQFSTENIWPLPVYVDSQGKEYEPVVSSGWGSPRWDKVDEEKYLKEHPGASSSDISSEKNKRTHRGGDIMYRRKSRSDKTGNFPIGMNGSEWHFIPEPFNNYFQLTPVMAVADAVVWTSAQSPRGWNISLDHGKPWVSYYQHLTKPTIPPISKGSGARQVKRGEVLGFVWYNPNGYKLKHLHFELWRGGGAEAAIDVEPIMKDWRKVRMP